MKNPDKFVELAQKLGISPDVLKQYMACKDAEVEESPNYVAPIQTVQVNPTLN